LLGDLELNGSLRLLLHYDRSRRDAITVRHVANAELHEIASAQLAVNGQVEQGQVSQSIRQLQANTDRPDVLQLQRSFLTDDLALVPWLAVCAVAMK
jgi:hypothetical protein